MNAMARLLWDAEITAFHSATQTRQSTSPAAQIETLEAAAHSQLAAMADVLKERVHPVLFVPSADGIVEGSSS